MEVAWFSMPEEGMAKLQQDQDHVNCFVLFFYWEAVVYREYAPLDQTIIKEYHFNILHQLRVAIQ